MPHSADIKESEASATPALEVRSVLDAACFPHLMDLILDAAPLPLLLTFRRTSHTFNTKVNTLLARGCYMVLKQKSNGEPVFAFRDSRSDSGTLVAKDVAMAVGLAPYVHVLDFDAGIDHRTLVDVEKKLDLKALKVTRVLNYEKAQGVYPFKSATYVSSINGFGEPSYDSHVYNCPYPKGTTKVIVNIATGSPDRAVSLDESQVSLLLCSNTILEIVIIFSSHSGPCTPPSDDEDRQSLLVLLFDFFFENPIKYTLVEVGFLAYRVEAEEPITDRDHNGMDESIITGSWDVAEREGLDYPDIRNIRRDEYRAEVGDALFALETMA